MERRYLVRQFDSNFFGYLRQSESVDNPEEYNSKKRKILGDGVFESFMHPKQFKIGKIELNAETEQKPKKELSPKTFVEKKQLKHKFNVI